MKALHFISALTLSLAFVSPAEAADPSTIMGKWITRSPDGKALITEFSPTSMAFYPVDGAGNPLGETKRAGATYEDLGGDHIAVTIKGGGGGVIIECESDNAIKVDIPGLYVLDLVRLTAK